jgi:hypothetical protein
MKTKWVLLASLALALAACAGQAGGRAPVPKGGYRGVSLPLPADQLAFLDKGDYVDVFVTFDAIMSDERKEKVTATILQHVLVLDLQKPAKADEKGVVELVLNPKEAQYAALSSVQGEVSVARRAAGDEKMVAMEMASFRKLFK